MTDQFSLEEALFDGKIEGIVATCFENERPLRGIAGLLDWRFRGLISHCLRVGAVTGKAGECSYLPVTHGGRTYHVILAGGGFLERGERQSLPAETYPVLRKNLASLKLKKLGASLADFGNVSATELTKQLVGIDLEVLP